MGRSSSSFLRNEDKNWRAKIDSARVPRKACMQVKTEINRKAGKEPEGGSKKRKEVGNQ